MEYKNVHIIYFSPTHTSAKTAYAIAEGLSGDVLLESDITYDAPAEELEIHDDELTIVAAPVYGGRVAETAMERLRAFHAHQAPVVPVVVYGNRDYEDALKELSDTLVDAGFVPVSQVLLWESILSAVRICPSPPGVPMRPIMKLPSGSDVPSRRSSKRWTNFLA